MLQPRSIPLWLALISPLPCSLLTCTGNSGSPSKHQDDVIEAVELPVPKAATCPGVSAGPAASPVPTPAGVGATGMGYERGSGAGFGGRGKRVPQVRQAKAKVTGEMDRDVIRRFVRSHINEVRRCYNAGLHPSPNLQGRVAIEFVIGPTGKVTSSKVRESTMKDSVTADCIAKAVEHWTFPKPKDGGVVTVVYPFNLSPG